jgi:hypothetical protein
MTTVIPGKAQFEGYHFWVMVHAFIVNGDNPKELAKSISSIKAQNTFLMAKVKVLCVVQRYKTLKD